MNKTFVSHNSKLLDLQLTESKIGVILEKLRKTSYYPSQFKKAFGTEEINTQRFLKALSQYMLTLVSADSKYDKVIRKEEKFTKMEQKGYDLFKKHCTSCHKEPLLTSNSFENNGLTLDTTLNDFGRMKITQNSKDSLKFKVPTLRNIEFTFPYMHDGRFKTLNEVVKHYNSGIQKSKTLSKPLQKPMNLSDNERTELIAFLKTLTDKEFLFNPKYGFPKKLNQIPN